jgi:hypothetical protein
LRKREDNREITRKEDKGKLAVSAVQQKVTKNMKKGGGRKNKGGKSGRVMGKAKGQVEGAAFFDLSCIIDPLDVPKRGGAEGKEVQRNVYVEDEYMQGSEKPFTRKGGLYLSGGRMVTRNSHLLPDFHITAVLNAADNVYYTTIESTLPQGPCFQH